MPRKKETLTLSVPPRTKEQLEEIARRLNIFWGKSPSPSGLIAAIAQQKLEVSQPFTLNSNQVSALRQATRVLVDSGFIEDAQTITRLLLERGNLEPPVRQQLLQQIGQPTEPWRFRLDQLIENGQPFHLLYRRNDGKEFEYTVRYAEIRPHAKRLYLDIWCEETEDSNDLSDLKHNRCLRLDKIITILDANGEWRGSLDYTEVQLHLLGGLAHNYEAKEGEDVKNEMVGEVRHVVKRVSTTFWLLGDVRRYGSNCVVLTPEELRERVKQEVRLQCQQYDLEIRS